MLYKIGDLAQVLKITRGEVRELGKQGVLVITRVDGAEKCDSDHPVNYAYLKEKRVIA